MSDLATQLLKVFAIGSLTPQGVQRTIKRDVKRVLPDLLKSPPAHSLPWSHNVPPDGGRANAQDNNAHAWLTLGFPAFTAYRYLLQVEDRGFTMLIEFSFLGQRYLKAYGQYRLVGQPDLHFIETEWEIKPHTGQKDVIYETSLA